MSIFYKLENVVCSYDGIKSVLEIDHLQLERGKIYFFLGASGIGKSTLLEILGVMNNPFLAGYGEMNYIDAQQKEYDLKQLWDKGDKFLSEFRKHHFSFIFQNTNLMPHFTAGENMAYTLLMEGMDWNTASEKVKTIMPTLSLDLELFERSIQQLSGGQRQRLAFVRAFASEFEILFGDEPTGNLDHKTAFSLMTELKNHVCVSNKAAIVVSHDVALAGQFADVIFYFTTIQKKGMDIGFVSQEQSFIKQNQVWYHNGQLKEAGIHETLMSYL